MSKARNSPPCGYSRKGAKKMTSNTLFTVGHSNYPVEVFLGMLQEHEINVVVDVRSVPYSRYNPQFNRDRISKSLRENRIKYMFFGKELGARTDDPSCYDDDGRVQYSRLKNTPGFQSAIKRLMEGAGSHRIALMCAEKDPSVCHRTILVSQELAQAGQQIEHILEDGSLEPHENILDKLAKPATGDLFV